MPRVRKKRLEFYVTEEEENLIQYKMANLKTKNLSGYLRKMAIDGYIINADSSDLKKLIYEVQKIGININQIVKLANSTNSIFKNDIEKLDEKLSEIWELQKEIISKSL